MFALFDCGWVSGFRGFCRGLLLLVLWAGCSMPCCMLLVLSLAWYFKFLVAGLLVEFVFRVL